MKINTLQENLIKAISVASRFTTNKAQLPILGNILLTADKTKLNITSTNLEISLSTSIGAKVEEEGSISIPSRVLLDIVSNLPKENVYLETSKEQLKITTTGFSSKVLGMDSTDFPKVPTAVDKSNSLNLPIKQFIEALSGIIFATSTDETRPVLTGVLLIFQKEMLQIVATDGFRLSRYILNIESKNENKIVIPKPVLMEVSKMGESESDLLLQISDKDKQILFGIGNTVLSSRLIEGDYPEFEKIIPKVSSVKVLVDKEELLRAVKLAAVFARDSANVIRIKVLKDSLEVVAESGVSGSQEGKVDAKVEGESVEVAFNYKFVEDFLHSVKGEEVKMEFTNNQTAGVFTDTSVSNYLHLIMPVRVQ